MLKKSILGNSFLVLTALEFKEFVTTGKTTHEEDKRRFYIVADEKGFPVIDHAEWLEQAKAENIAVSFAQKADYIEAGERPYKG